MLCVGSYVPVVVLVRLNADCFTTPPPCSRYDHLPSPSEHIEYDPLSSLPHALNVTKNSTTRVLDFVQ